MKRILLLGLTVGVSFAFATVSATARDLDGRYADSPLHDTSERQRTVLLHS